MDNDQLQRQWRAYDRSLDTLLRLRRQPLEQQLSRTYEEMRRSSRGAVARAVLGLVLGAAVLLLLGSFLGDHVAVPHLLVPAVVLQVYVIASLVLLGRQLFWIHAIDYQRPVLEIQRHLERLRIERLRSVKLVWLLAPLLWIPILIVGVKAVTGVDVVGSLPPAWLVANLLFGLAWIPLAWWGARRLAARGTASPLGRRIARDLAGKDLTAAREFLAELERFESAETV